MQIKDLIIGNKIYGVVGNSGSGKTSFVNDFVLSKDVGIVNYGIIECNLVSDQIEYYDKLFNYKIKELESRKQEIVKMLEIDKKILDSSIYEISESELSKVLLASILLYNPEIVVIDEMLDSLDYKNKVKIMKLLIKLKKFFNKKIVIVDSNIDDIFEFIDDVIIIDSGKVLLHGDKYKVYDNILLLKEKNIRIPNIISFIVKMREKGINIDNVDNINELIKSIYREMR